MVITILLIINTLLGLVAVFQRQYTIKQLKAQVKQEPIDHAEWMR